MQGIVLLANCTNGNKTGKNVQSKKPDSVGVAINLPISKANDDSIQLTKLVRAMYKWHETDTTRAGGFSPVKKNPRDTFYSGIDLNANNNAVTKLQATGLFANDFLDDYRKIAERMDKELHDGSSSWAEGELPSFEDDVDEWCNCQDYPDNYWEKLTLTNIRLNKSEATFKWTWGDGFYYKTKAKKENNVWKISYLEGFDMSYYNWERATKHQ
ncbi:hypothetical protein [Mucilaginibacter sp.]|jgi:hypothetical protein|uniref:hypothetical protein n=1 Tax=Mucilaginibacter sp. TaxID=1882438 RepID=UPI002BB56F9C|nr:hypothetical protein [Mucilaginibacter sp.]HTI57406.1 hypothetical protein [Mucilaginibacter sp.]